MVRDIVLAPCVKILTWVPLKKLIDIYCSRLGCPDSSLVFTVDGELIAADDTVEKLGVNFFKGVQTIKTDLGPTLYIFRRFLWIW